MGRRLTLVVPSLALGGAERVVASMANYWSARGDVTVVTLSTAADDTYFLDARVARSALGLMCESQGAIQRWTNNVARVRRLRTAIAASNPDVVVSFTDRMNVVTLLACRPLQLDVVISERVDPSRYDIGRIWSFLRRRYYPSAQSLVVQTQSVRAQMLPVMRGRPVYVIPNAVESPSTTDASSGARAALGDVRWIMGMGRLAPQKGFDLLIEAFSRIAARHAQWSVRILGEGPERPRLEALIAQRGLVGRVLLPGWEPDPTSTLRGSEIFVLSSRFEGFPNALLEAMACGVPSISFDCESGPAAIIRNNVDGLLVRADDTAALAAAIERMIADETLRRRLGAEAVHVVERFGIERYYARWEAVLHREHPDSVDRI